MNFLHQLATAVHKRLPKNPPLYPGVIAAVCFLEKLPIPEADGEDVVQQLDNILAPLAGSTCDSVMIERLEPGQWDEGQPRYRIQLLADV